MKNTKLLFSALVSAATLSFAPALSAAADLTWAGSDGDSWDYSSENWLVGGKNSTYFSYGDNVTFGSNESNETVDVDNDVLAGDIIVSGEYTFTQASDKTSLTANSLTVSDGGELTLSGIYVQLLNGLTVGKDSALTISAATVVVGIGNDQEGLVVAGTISGGGTLALWLTDDAKNNKIDLGNGNDNGFSGKVEVYSGSFSLSDSDIGSGTYSISWGVSMWSSSTTEVSNNIELRYDTKTLTVDSGATLTLSGTLSGEGGIDKQGVGTLILSGENTYEGRTTISAGTLVARNDSALGKGTVSINGGQLSVSEGITLNKTTIEIVLSEAYNSEGGIAAIDGSGSLAAGTTISLSLDDALANAILESETGLSFQILGGDLARNSSGIDVSSFLFGDSSYGDLYELSYASDTGVLTLSVIPEPSAFGLLAGLGALAFVAARRRRSRKA